MNRTALVLTAVAALAASGCADNQTSVEFAGICAAPSDPTTCTFPATCSAITGEQVVDVSITETLALVVQLNNQNPNNASADTFRANSRDAYYTEIEVEYDSPVTAPSWKASVGPFRIPAGGSQTVDVLPINTLTPVAMAAADALAAGALGPGDSFQVVAQVRLRGTYQDQSEWETAQIPFAIQVCNACLRSVAAIDCDPVTAGVQLPVACPHSGQLPASYKCL